MIISANRMSELKSQYGDAFYLLDSAQFRANFLELKEAFSNIYPHFNIAYSYKTNYTPKLCRIVNELGGYAEVVSDMEMDLALKVGVEPRKIIWNGPVKNSERVENFLLSGGTLNVDALEEIKIIREIAGEHPEKILNIGIRCNYDVSDGIVSRFGFDVDSNDFEQVIEFVNSIPNIKLINLQCHFAKRQIEYWEKRAKGMVDLIDKIGIIPERIDLGGGLFGKMEESLKSQFTSEIPSYEVYAEVVATIIAERFRNDDNEPELIIEPGTAIVGDCMKFAGTIKSIKCIRGKYIASVLGSQKNIGMAGVNPPIEIYAMGNKQKEYKDIDFVGFTCIENDCLYKNYSGLLGIEDMIVIGNCGSYSVVMKPPFILPNFPVLDISDGGVDVIKNAERFDDIFGTYNY